MHVWCARLGVTILPSSDAEHRRRPAAGRGAGAQVHLLLQLVHRALLSPAQGLPPRLRQTAADGVGYGSSSLALFFVLVKVISLLLLPLQAASR